MLSLCLLLCLTVTTRSSTLPHQQSPRTGRAVGVFTVDDYWHKYTKGNKDLLTYYHLHNKRMVKDNSVRPTSETIEWSQKSRCWFGCEEEYLLVDYYEDGDQSNPVMKVFVARELGSPPEEFSTSGSGAKGTLHFGYLNFHGTGQAIFFVMQPSDWYPFQHNFKTNNFESFFKDSLESTASWALGASIGSIIPGAGPVVGAAIGFAIDHFTDDLFGEYLRYIG